MPVLIYRKEGEVRAQTHTAAINASDHGLATTAYRDSPKPENMDLKGNDDPLYNRELVDTDSEVLVSAIKKEPKVGRNTRGVFQIGVKQESVTFMPPNKEVKINNIKPFPVNWT